ncbi:M3 family metallopeptidase [Aquincola sp. J276]|uniref:M3 family metallopeptidase n=1 Tax=Aquincola sp. J276 TaxID=2898432 RepID=UPI002151EEDF|nr:M3 family metallopeptidase [Aquincola sp. J276]MCR5865169.1 M3 family metallopeptidase [Aquincola sp. J276]
MTDLSTNPLLKTGGLPAFDAIQPEHVGPAVDQLLADASAALERAVSDEVPATYEAMSAVLDVATERLGTSWGAVSHLSHVMDTPALRAAYTENLPKISEFYTRLGADERLYAKYKAIANAPEAAQLSAPRRKALANAMRDFVLSGAELQGEAKARFAKIQERLSELSQQYREHVLDATDAFSYCASDAEMAGVPEDVREAARNAAAADEKEGYKITLQFPSYYPVMQYASDRSLREKIYTAYVTRASELGPPERDNSAVMTELLQLRQEEAQLLGYGSYADVSLVPKMAESPEQVKGFLADLAARARPYAERDLQELRQFAASELGLTDLKPWDTAFASERLKQARYAFSDNEVKQYFTEPKVLDGLFRIIETVFEVQIRPDTAPVWHEHVRFFRVEREGTLLAQFYLDPYARQGKQGGAWMDDVRVRWARPEGTLQTPVAHLVCNFPSPQPGRPALLTHDDVITLFHEFGHGLHLMLTQVADIGVSGLSGVEWDAVELPSQFMENFTWEWEVLQRLTAHVDTGEPLPRALFDKMIAAKNFQSGMATLRQIEFALFDMRLHHEPGAATQVQQVLDEVRREVAVLEATPFNRSQHTFSHIFAGGYAAGYYSYKWAEVLSADAWGAFEETGPLDVETGRRLRREVLEVGGSRPAMDNFKAFRGREPSIDALMRHQGMV